MKIQFLLIVTQFFLLSACGKVITVQTIPQTADTNVVLPPSWAFGIIYGSYANQEQSIELTEQLLAHDYPVDAFWTDSWIWDWANQGRGPARYIDFIADTISYSDMNGFWNGYLSSKGIKAGMWVWDCIQKTGNEEVFEDFKSKGFFRDEFIHTTGWHNGSMTTIIGDQGQKVKGTLTGNIDFENPEAVSYFKQKMKHFFDKGVDFIKLDKTDAIPVAKVMFEMSQELGKETQGRGFVMTHSHGVEREEYKKYPGKWTDDTRSDWSVGHSGRVFSPWLPRVAFKENIAMYTDTSRHFWKIPFLANDMGGFAVSNDGFVDEELYIRWTQFAMFVPLTTVFSQPENPTGNIAFKVSATADSVFRKYAQLKMQLFPYIYSYAHRSRWDGVNTIRPIPGYLYQYLLGNELLVAPVCEQGAVTKAVFLPEGSTWYDWRTGRNYQGGQLVTVDAPLTEIPVLVRAGSIIPLRDYARSVEIGSNDTLRLHVFTGDEGEFVLYEDDGNSNDYLNGSFATTTFSLKARKEGYVLTVKPVKGHFSGMQKSRYYQLIVHGQIKEPIVMLKGRKMEIVKVGHSYVSETLLQADKQSPIVLSLIINH